jgi:Uma2 family endonuclease
MVQTPQKSKTLNQTFNQWQTADWETFVAIADHPASAKAKCYYFQSQMRVETMGVGPNHAVDNGLIYAALVFYCTLKAIRSRGLLNASYRKSGYNEAQPDISYYLGAAAAIVPDSNTIIDLDACPPPDLAIEIAATSLSDDLGMKRLLYESLGIKEYWVVNVEQGEIIAFEILSDRGSQRITTSIVLPGLAIATLEAALRSRSTQDDSQIMAQLMTQFQIVVNN